MTTPAGRRTRRAGAALALAAALCSCDAAGTGPTPAEPAVVQRVESEGARLELSLDRDALSIADSAVLRLAVESAEADRVEFPESEDGFGDFAVTRDEPVAERLLEGGAVARGREYALQPFLPGEYELPALTVLVNGSPRLVSDPIPVTVESVLEDPEAAELEDIAGPVDVPVPWWWWAVAALVAAALAAAGAYWRKRRKAALSASRVVPPHEAALAALDALLGRGLPGPDEVKRFYMRLSDIVRRYVEERFGLRAPEQTTEEFLAAMAASPAVGREHQRLLRSFLEQADMVKFAKFTPGRDEAEDAVDAARRFVRQTAPDELLAPGGRPA